MNAFVKTVLVSLAATAACAGASRAADLPVPMPKAKPERAVPSQAPNDFDRLGADCISATDGCRGYVRAVDGKFDATNNIGIACQPNALTCTKRK